MNRGSAPQRIQNRRAAPSSLNGNAEPKFSGTRNERFRSDRVLAITGPKSPWVINLVMPRKIEAIRKRRGRSPQRKSQTMHAVRIHNYGGPEVLKYEDAPRPQVGNGNVLIRVYAAGVNAADWKVRAGHMRDFVRHELPLILGWEVSGRRGGNRIGRLAIQQRRSRLWQPRCDAGRRLCRIRDRARIPKSRSNPNHCITSMPRPFRVSPSQPANHWSISEN